MPRETMKAKRARIAMLLADYDEKSRALRKMDRDVKEIKEQIHQLEPGTYDDWSYTEGPSREILDQPAVKALCAELGKEVPMTTTRPSIIVQHVAASKR